MTANADTTTAIPADILAEHVAEIKRLCKRGVSDVAEIGSRLTACKELLDHGDWLPFLEKEFGWSEDTAERFIQVARLTKQIPQIAEYGIPLSGVYLLAAKSTPPQAREEIIELAEAGEKVTVADVKTAIAKTKPEPKRKTPAGVNPACIELFENEDQIEAFADAVTTVAARKYITLDQQLEIAEAIEGRRNAGERVRVGYIKGFISNFVHEAAKAQGKIDEEETRDFYKQVPGGEVHDAVTASHSAARVFIASVIKLKRLFRRYPHHPFFGNVGREFENVIQTISQYRRTAGEESPEKIERKLARLQQLDHTQLQETAITALRSEVEVGEDSATELQRLRVYIGGLENDKRQLEIKVKGLEAEVEDAKAAARWRAEREAPAAGIRGGLPTNKSAT
jgi:hypothetical protein